MAKTAVAIVSCVSYDPPAVRKAVGEIFSLLPGLCRTGTRRRTGEILLKVDLSHDDRTHAGITNPVLIEEAGVRLGECGARVTIGESCDTHGWRIWRNLRATVLRRLTGTMRGWPRHRAMAVYRRITGACSMAEITSIPVPGLRRRAAWIDGFIADRVRECFAANGVLSAAERIGAGARFLDFGPVVQRRSHARLFMNRVMLHGKKYSRIVLMPKICIDPHGRCAGALGSCMSMVSTPLRERLRRIASIGGRSDEMLVDVFSAVAPRPAVLSDGIQCTDMQGGMRSPGLLIAATDPAAHDAVLARLAGRPVRAARIARNAGRGECSMRRIEIRGITVHEARSRFRTVR